MLRPEIERAGLDFWPGTIMTPRSFYMVSPLLYDTTNEAQVKAAYDVYRRLVRLTGEAGYGLYRGHIEFMDDIAAQYDWGDHAMLRLYGTLKDALDLTASCRPASRASGQVRWRILGLNPRITGSSAASRRSSHDDRTHGRFHPGHR
jgi:hypothetical protein